jgi:hypothetical protein
MMHPAPQTRTGHDAKRGVVDGVFGALVLRGVFVAELPLRLLCER